MDAEITCSICGAKFKHQPADRPPPLAPGFKPMTAEQAALLQGWITASKRWACPTCQRRRYDERHDKQGR